MLVMGLGGYVVAKLVASRVFSSSGVKTCSGEFCWENAAKGLASLIMIHTTRMNLGWTVFMGLLCETHRRKNSDQTRSLGVVF